AFRVPKHHLRSKPSIHVHLRGKIKLFWSRSEYPVSKYIGCGVAMAGDSRVTMIVFQAGSGDRHSSE
ncbi:MAG: hypothetical protein WCK35_27220, partial [Chloroflexota bacterium]